MAPDGDRHETGRGRQDPPEGGPHGIIIRAPHQVPVRTRVHAYLWEGVLSAEWPVVFRGDRDGDAPRE
jgi:hypothetical protein